MLVALASPSDDSKIDVKILHRFAHNSYSSPLVFLEDAVRSVQLYRTLEAHVIEVAFVKLKGGEVRTHSEKLEVRQVLPIPQRNLDSPLMRHVPIIGNAEASSPPVAEVAHAK